MKYLNVTDKMEIEFGHSLNEVHTGQTFELFPFLWLRNEKLKWTDVDGYVTENLKVLLLSKFIFRRFISRAFDVLVKFILEESR